MFTTRVIVFISLFSFIVAEHHDNGFDLRGALKRSSSKNRRHNEQQQQQIIAAKIITNYNDNNTDNNVTISPAPSSSEPPTIAPTIPTTPEPSPTPSTSPPEPTPSPADNDPNHHHHHHEWWNKLEKIVIKTIMWMIFIVLCFFGFGAIFSNRYRIYYYLRGSFYELVRKIKRRNDYRDDGIIAPSVTLNDVVFAPDNIDTIGNDNNLEENLLDERETS